MRGGYEKIQLESVLLKLLELNGIDKSQISSTKLQMVRQAHHPEPVEG
jgi:hypothetical protein